MLACLGFEGLSSQTLNVMARVREVIPEVVEIGPLSTLNQGFRGRSIEAEMLNVRVVVKCLPATHSRQERIHQDEFGHFRRDRRCASVADHEADVVSYDLALLHSEGFSEAMNAYGGALDIQAVGRNIRVPGVRQIRRDYIKALGTRRNDWLPHQRVLSIAVQQDERPAVE